MYNFNGVHMNIYLFDHIQFDQVSLSLEPIHGLNWSRQSKPGNRGLLIKMRKRLFVNANTCTKD